MDFASKLSLFLVHLDERTQKLNKYNRIPTNTVNTASGQPVEGAAIVAAWYMTGMEGAHVATLAAGETVTAADGMFTIDGWGPKFTKSLFAKLPSDMPKLFIFKDGYLPTIVENIGSGPPYRFHGPEKLTSSFLDEAVFPIEPFSGSLAEYLPQLDALNSRIRKLRTGPNCEWKQIAKFILAIDAVAQTATRRGLERGAGLTKLSIAPRDCGTAAEFFGVVDRGLVPCESRKQCLETIQVYEGLPEDFSLPVSPWVNLQNDGVADAVEARGWELDGFSVAVGYRVYRVKQRHDD